MEDIYKAQIQDPQLIKIMEAMQNGSRIDFIVEKDGILMHENRVCISKIENLRKQIMEEAHCSAYAMHPGSIKIYRTIKQSYGLNGIKRG